MSVSVSVMRRVSPTAAVRITGLCDRQLATRVGWCLLGFCSTWAAFEYQSTPVVAQQWAPTAARRSHQPARDVDPAAWMQEEIVGAPQEMGPGQRSSVVASDGFVGPAMPVPGRYFEGEGYPGDEVYAADGEYVEWAETGQMPLFPNRPYLVPRVVDRLRWRPLFPNRPYLRGSWPGGPPLEQPRTFWLNPFAVQQGLGNFLFRGNQPADTGSLGFPFSVVPSHLVDRVPRPYLGHGQPYIGPRHIDRGQPLMGTSWVNRPYYVDGYTGALFGWNLTENLKQTHGTISGLRVGWDYEHFWGAQFGMGFGSSNTDPGGSDVSIRLADVSVMYYPWGDSRWRPYTGLGLGVGKYSFLDETGGSVDEFAMQIPLSMGVKYAFRPWWALRLDATNYLVLPANELKFINQLALTLGLEIRFGGQRRSYFPYSPSIQLR